MIKIHLGCGGFLITGWSNHDQDVDLRKPLPWAAGEVSFIFAEHVIEHLAQKDAWAFLVECRRILAPGGVVRLTFPSIVKLRKNLLLQDNQERYTAWLRRVGLWQGDLSSALYPIIALYGHQSLWEPSQLVAVLEILGFSAYEAELYRSIHPELRDLEQHWRVHGRFENDIQSATVEGVKS